MRNVQALRAVAALLVVGAHVDIGFERNGPIVQNTFGGFGTFGQFGVDIFFVISGFIMVATSWDNFGRIGAARSFILRRIVRIYPLYWIILAPIVAIYFLAAHTFMPGLAGRADVFASVSLLPQAGTPLLPVSWTLTFEMFFYIVFMAMLLAKRVAILPTLLVWTLLEIIAFGLFHDALNPYVRFLGMPLPIEFTVGALVGYLYRSQTMPFVRPIALLGIVGAIAMWALSSQPSVYDDLRRSDLMRVVEFGLPAACIVYGAVGLEIRNMVSAPSWAVALGNASYAIYLCHMPIGAVLDRLASRLHIRGPAETLAAAIMIIAIVLAFSLALHRFFERPITNTLQRLIRERFRAPSDIRSITT